MSSRRIDIFAATALLIAFTCTAAPTFNKAMLKQDNRLCNGNQLKPEYTKPTCKGWQSSDGNPNDKSLLIQNYPDACADGIDGVFRCYFKTGKEACIANAKIIENDGLASSKFCACGQAAGTNNFGCGYCDEDQECNQNGTFLSGNNCPDGTGVTGYHNIGLVDPIPTGAYHSYCGIEVNGPYSNLANPDGTETYVLCGTTQTQAYPGLEFAEEQKNQIKNVNSASNGGMLKSDLAGFCYPKPPNKPCIQPHPTKPGKCVEPVFLPGKYDLRASRFDENALNVHHVVPARDRRGLKCPCGKNSVKNAVVISAQLNRYFLNYNRTGFLFDCDSGMTEIEKVNSLPKYNTSLVAKPR